MNKLSTNNISVHCRSCGFPFQTLRLNRVRLLICPACGDESDAPGYSSAPSGEVHLKIPSAHHDQSFQKASQWGILFVAVCLQALILILAPFYVYHVLKFSDNPSGEIASRKIAKHEMPDAGGGRPEVAAPATPATDHRPLTTAPSPPVPAVAAPVVPAPVVAAPAAPATDHRPLTTDHSPPVPVVAKPADPAPVVAKPADPAPAVAAPATPASAVAKPADPAPAVAKPADPAPAVAKPADPAPAVAAPATPATDHRPLTTDHSPPAPAVAKPADPAPAVAKPVDPAPAVAKPATPVSDHQPLTTDHSHPAPAVPKPIFPDQRKESEPLSVGTTLPVQDYSGSSIVKVDPFVPSVHVPSVPVPREVVPAPSQKDVLHEKKEKMLSQYETQLSRARGKLTESYEMIAIDPEQALFGAIRALRMYEELGQAVPSIAYWIVSQAYASLSWGEMIVEESPPLEHFTVSADSRWLLTRNRDGAVMIWDILRTQKTLEEFEMVPGDYPFVKVLFTSDLRLAIGGTADGTIRIWDASSKNRDCPVITLPLKVRGLRDMQISPDGRWLVAYGGSGLMTAGQNEPSNTNIVPFPPAPFPLVRPQTSVPESPSVRMSNWTGILPPCLTKFFPIRNEIGTKIQPAEQSDRILLVNYNDRTGGIDVSATGNQEGINAVWLWDLNLLREGINPPPIILRGHERPIRVMQISSDSKWLVTGSDDATARVYNLQGSSPGADQAVLKGHRLGVTALAIGAKGGWVATGSQDNTIRLWSLPGKSAVPFSTVLTGHLGWISNLVVEESEERLISGSYDKTIRIWQIPGGRIEAATDQAPFVVHNDQGAIRQLLLSKDGRILISLGADSSLRIRGLDKDIDLRHSAMIRNRMLLISQIALSPDNRWLIFDYVNQLDESNSGMRLWPLRLDELTESATAFCDH